MGAIDHDSAALVAANLEELWQAHGPTGLRLATVLVGPADAHDVAVSAFLRVTLIAGESEIGNFRNYLLRAIRNEAHSLFRSRRRRQRRDVAALPERFANDPIGDVDLRTAIAGLGLRQRTVLFLAYWEDLTEAAIADTLGLSRGTVHRDLQRARDRLGKALQ
jgi:RNA polymerase sigma-70 factor (ECF subfamily)